MSASTGADGDGNDPAVDIEAVFGAIEATTPLVHAVTNTVTINGVANAILHWGGLPVMADSRREAPEMVATAEGCLLNVNDVSETGEATMLETGRAANSEGVPIVLDPVGMGATPTRTAVTERLVEELDIAIINGNRAEIGAIAGEADASEIRGVEAVGESGPIEATAIACARESGAVVVASGERDVVATGEVAYEISAGHPAMGRVVGTGCMFGGTLAVFAASAPDTLEAALAGTLAYGLAGEQAGAGEYGEYAGPASYEVAFRDAMAGFDPVTATGATDRIEYVPIGE
jgi:hydroxyethylthiazole kinase